jgi:hypothetical protein
MNKAARQKAAYEKSQLRKVAREQTLLDNAVSREQAYRVGCINAVLTAVADSDNPALMARERERQQTRLEWQPNGMPRVRKNGKPPVTKGRADVWQDKARLADSVYPVKHRIATVETVAKDIKGVPDGTPVINEYFAEGMPVNLNQVRAAMQGGGNDKPAYRKPRSSKRQQDINHEEARDTINATVKYHPGTCQYQKQKVQKAVYSSGIVPKIRVPRD